MLPCPQQRFLHYILGPGPVTGQPQGIAQQSGGMLVVEHPHHGGIGIVQFRRVHLTVGSVRASCNSAQLKRCGRLSGHGCVMAQPSSAGWSHDMTAVVVMAVVIVHRIQSMVCTSIRFLGWDEFHVAMTLEVVTEVVAELLNLRAVLTPPAAAARSVGAVGP